LKKILFISLAVVLGLSVGLIGCDGGPVAPDAIKVGLVRDLDGVLVFYDQMSGGPVYRAFNKTVNDAGGIYMSEYGEKLPLELTIRNYDPMAPGELGDQTTALITQDDVHFVWGAPGTTTIYTQASICNAYGIVLHTLEGGATDMMADPEKLASWPYVWINLSFSDWYQIPVLWETLKDQGVTTPKAYVVYIDNEHGHEYRDVTISVFGAGNVTAVGHDQYMATQSDIDDLVNDAITALNVSGSGPDYEVFCAFTYMPYLGYIMTSFDSFDFDPPSIMMGPGASSGAFDLAFGGAMMEGVSAFAVANNKTDVSPQDTTMSFAAMWNLVMPQATGFPPAFTWDVWGHPIEWAGLELWQAAVEEVGHLDVGYSAEVRDVLASFNATNPCTTVIGDTWYEVFGGGLGGGVIDYECMPGQICQWQSGYTEIVGPSTPPYSKYDTTASFIYPMTGSWGWL
jgi:ABC-type branched-subunit amino acid transport system substrate-binding protein